MSKRRITIEVLSSGQPRPYADSRHHVRVVFEWQGIPGFGDKNAPFIPDPTSEQHVRAVLPHLQCGFLEKVAKDSEWYETRLDFLKEIEPGTWEFRTTSPFTD